MFGLDLPVIVFLLIVFLPFIINIKLALSRDKSVLLVLLLTFIFSWIVTLILAFLPEKQKYAAAGPDVPPDFWAHPAEKKIKCPNCSAKISPDVIYCQSCGTEII